MSAKNISVASAAAVRNFDRSPDSALNDLSVVQALTCKSRATLYRWIAKGDFPEPRKIGASRNFWTSGEIRKALGI